jgi:hypothetical protein
LIFNFDLEYLNKLQSYEPLHIKMPQTPASSAHGLYRILTSYWLAHFYFKKKSAKVLHYYLGLDCGMLEFCKYYTHEPSSNEQLLTPRIFGVRFGGKSKT